MKNVTAFRILLASILLLTTSGAAFAQLQFQIERPFRFFKYESDYAIQRIAFDLLKGAGNDSRKITVERLEQELADPKFWKRDFPANARATHAWPLAWKGKDPIEIVKNLRKKEHRERVRDSVRQGSLDEFDIIERYGWAALLDTHLNGDEKSGICWNLRSRTHDGCNDYVLPKLWKVRVFEASQFHRTSDDLLKTSCEWQVFESDKRTQRSPLSKEQSLQPCAEAYFNVSAITGRSKTPSGSIFVVRKDSNGTETTLLIEIKDRLVVGIGDSFASGEGNPDRPVVFKFQASTHEFPQRPSEDFHWAAHWIDRSCHRSSYSWQVRSTLHQALMDPTNAVTFLGYACSGAEVAEGFFYQWGGPEPFPGRPNVAQLAAIYNELCERSTNIAPQEVPWREQDAFLKTTEAKGDPWKARHQSTVNELKAKFSCSQNSAFKRPMNALLLSVGGNDLGFAKWIAGAILRGYIEGMAGGFIPDTCATDKKGDTSVCDLTNARIRRLTARYAALREVLEEKLLKDGEIKPSSVIMTGYLKATSGKNLLACPKSNAGMTISLFGNDTFLAIFNAPGNKTFAIREPEELKTIEHFRDKHLMEMVKLFAKGKGDNQFKLVDGFIPEFEGRGFCATENTNELREFDRPSLGGLELMDDEKNIDETLHIPRIGGKSWLPYEPYRWRPYASRLRLLRTPNDVFMTVNNKPRNTLETTPIGLRDMPYRATSGAFHPTAEAHSKMAKHVATVLADVLAEK